MCGRHTGPCPNRRRDKLVQTLRTALRVSVLLLTTGRSCLVDVLGLRSCSVVLLRSLVRWTGGSTPRTQCLFDGWTVGLVSGQVLSCSDPPSPTILGPNPLWDGRGPRVEDPETVGPGSTTTTRPFAPCFEETWLSIVSRSLTQRWFVGIPGSVSYPSVSSHLSSPCHRSSFYSRSRDLVPPSLRKEWVGEYGDLGVNGHLTTER